MTEFENYSKQELVAALKEARTELSVINSVQETLAASQDLQSIYAAIGDKIVEIFEAQTVGIYAADLINNLMQFPYMSERGVKKTSLDPVRLNSMYQHVIESGQTFVMNHGFADYISKFSDYQIPYGEAPKSGIVVPVIQRENVWIAISLQDMDDENVFSESDIQFLETLAASMKVALENAHLFDQVQSQNQEITEALERETASKEILSVIAESPTDIQPVFDVIAKNAAQLSGSDDVVIAFADDDTLRVAAHYGDIPMIPVGKGNQLNKDSVTGRAILEGKSLQAIHNQPGVKSGYPAGDKVAKKYGYHVTCAVPLMREGKAVGAFSIRRTKPELLTEQQIELIQSFANQAAIAIQNARLFDEITQRNAELAIINSVGEAMSRNLDVKTVVKIVGDTVQEIFKSDTVIIGLLNKDGSMADIRYGYTFGVYLPFQSVPASSGISSRIIANRKPLLFGTHDEREGMGGVELQLPDDARLEIEGNPESWMGVPIIVGDKLIGVVNVMSYQKNIFKESDLNLLSTLSNNMGVALENARLFEETQLLLKETEERNAELAVINSVQEGLASKLEMKAIYELVGDKLREIFKADTCFIAFHDEDRTTVTFPYYADKTKTISGTRPYGKGIYEPIVESGKPLVIGSAEETEKLGRYDIQSPGSSKDLNESILGVPIYKDGEVIGATTIQSYEKNAYTKSDLRLLQTLTNSMSVALESARLFDETQRLLKETEARNAELAVINSVQTGLASKLDMQAIYDLVGDKIRDVFDAQIVTIVSYDRENAHNVIHYAIENGKRYYFDPQPTTAMYKELMATGKPIIIQENLAEQLLGKANIMENSEGQSSSVPKSGVWIPLTVGETVMGHVSLQNVDRENAFSDSDVRLLQTLSNSMSIALESARLFDETQRLLKETEERNAELAVINSVQEGLASKLELEGIYTLVGDKISEITGAGVVLIASWDWEKRTMRAEYFRDQEKLFDKLERPLSPLHDAVFPEIEEGKTIVWNEGIEERYRKFGHEAAAGQIPKSTVAVPLKIGGEISSSIMIQDTEKEYAFSEGTIRLVETLARSAGIALENAQLFDETTQRNAELAIVNSVSEAMSKNLDVDTVVKIVGDKVQQIFNADVVGIGFNNEEKGVVELPYSYALGDYFEEESFPLGQGLAGIIFKSRQPLLLNTEEELRELGSVKTAADQQIGEQIQSWLGVPIIIGEKLIGGVSVQSYQTYAFDDSDLRLLSTLAANMGAVIENARLFEETRRLLKETEERNAELAVINSVQTGLASKLDMQAIYSLVGDKVSEITGSEIVVINTWDKEKKISRYEYIQEKGERFDVVERPFTPLTEALLPEMEQGKTVIWNEGMEQRLKKFNHALPVGEMPLSVIQIPIKTSSQINTSISLQDTTKEYAFSLSTIRLVETLAGSMGVALENARLFDELQGSYQEISESLERQTATGEILHIMANSPGEIQPVLEAVARHAANLCQADDVQIYQVEGDHLRQTAHFGPLPALEDTEILPLDKGLITGRAVLERRTISIDAGDLDAEEFPLSVDLQTRLKHRSLIVTPLVREEESVGAIVVRRNDIRPFTEIQIDLLKTFSDQAAIAIENVRLFNETQRLLAESIQQAEELKTINTVSKALSSELEIDTLIDLVGTQIQKIFSADVAYVALLNKETGFIEFPFNYGEQAEKLKFGEGLTSQVIKLGEPLLINQDEDWQKTEERIGVIKSKSYLGVPITLGGEVIGVISVQSTKWSNMYGEKEERLLSTIAGNVGVAIHNANLFDEVERQKNYFEALISSAPVAIINMDMEGKVTEWSPAAESLFGYSTEEAMGADIDDLVANHPDVREEAEMLTQDYLESVGKIQLKSQRAHKDGHLIDVAINAMPVYLEGEMTGYIAIYNDISELEKARRDAEEANQAKSAFLANMSHELRTPLNAIIGFTRIVKRKATDKLAEKQINNLDKVLVSAEHLLGLINTVLDISKIEAGRMDLHITNFDIKSLIDLVLVTSQPLVREEKVRLFSEVPEDLPIVHSDLEKIKQILINLVSNAAKFTHEGEIKVGVKDVNDHLEITVADTGIGISPDSIDRIFQEFQQADVSTTREYGGTGLGLSISRSLARLLGGDLRVSSELGVGSTFTLSFPTYYGEAIQEDVEKPAVAPGDDTSHLILIIDDNEDAIYLMRESLEDAGYRVAIAQNGEEGLRLARELNPFAITLDIMMPKKDGWQVLHDLKSDPATQKIPVIMVSIVDKKALGYRLGASDYLVKPLKDDQIHQALEKIKKTNGNKPLKRLLVVDDDPNVAEMVQQLLEDRDYEIESAPDGLVALEKIQEHQPDVILLDLMMPRLDGLGLIEKLKNDPDLAAIPVIVITAKLLDEKEKKALRESVGKVIHKQGLSSQVLLAEIGKTLKNTNAKETSK